MSAARFIRRGLGIGLALAAWEAGGRSLGEALFAPFSAVVVELGSLITDGRTLVELGKSLRQMLAGFLLACAIGMPLGIAMGRSKVVDAILHPWLSMFIVTSVAALVPLFILLFGTGFWFRVAVVFTASVWYILLTTYQGARGVDARWVDVGLSFGAGPLKRFASILLPALYPYLITAARIGLVHAIRAMVVAEMFIIVGYGGLIYSAGLSVSTAPLLGLLLIVMITGIVANVTLREAGRWLAPWFETRLADQSAP